MRPFDRPRIFVIWAWNLSRACFIALPFDLRDLAHPPDMPLQAPRTALQEMSVRYRGPAQARPRALRDTARSCRRPPRPGAPRRCHGRALHGYPGNLLTATRAPTPLPQIRMPRSDLPSRISRASSAGIIRIVHGLFAICAQVPDAVPLSSQLPWPGGPSRE